MLLRTGQYVVIMAGVLEEVGEPGRVAAAPESAPAGTLVRAARKREQALVPR